MSSDPHDDELLLNRYLDGELDATERAALERRLHKEPDLRDQLAELTELAESIDAGLGTVVPGVPAKPGAHATRAENPDAPPPRLSQWIRHYPLRAAACVLLCVVAGAGVVAGLRAARPATPQAPAAGPIADVAAGGIGAETDEERAEIQEILDPSTEFERRHRIYTRWAKLDPALRERLVWSMGPRETNVPARALMFYSLVPGPVRDYPALIRAARSEWDAKALKPLVPLISLLALEPVEETRRFFEELLLGLSTEPQGFGEIVAVIQATFPADPAIGRIVIGALRDPDETVRVRAALARASIRQRDGIECAGQLLHSNQREVRLLAATTISRHGTDADIPLLIAMVDDPDPDVRGVARAALEARKIPIPKTP